MKTLESVIATTRIDRQNERMALSCLEGMVEQVRSDIIPILRNHDPRIPPIGRLLSARIDKLADGEFAIVGTLQTFEEGEEIPLLEVGRTIPIRVPFSNFEVVFDRSYRLKADQDEIDHLVGLVKASKQEEGKKALEPLSILAIAGIYLLGKFAEGFLQKVGEDSWEAFTSAIKRLMGRKRVSTSEFVLQFQFVPSNLPYPLSVQVNITNPSDDDVDIFLSEGMKALDAVVPTLISTRSDLRTLVFDFSRGKTRFRFAIRKDSAPVLPSAASLASTSENMLGFGDTPKRGLP